MQRFLCMSYTSIKWHGLGTSLDDPWAVSERTRLGPVHEQVGVTLNVKLTFGGGEGGIGTWRLIAVCWYRVFVGAIKLVRGGRIRSGQESLLSLCTWHFYSRLFTVSLVFDKLSLRLGRVGRVEFGVYIIMMLAWHKPVVNASLCAYIIQIWLEWWIVNIHCSPIGFCRPSTCLLAPFASSGIATPRLTSQSAAGTHACSSAI